MNFSRLLLIVYSITLVLSPVSSFAAMPNLPFTINMSEAVNVNTTGGTPRISINVGGKTRYAVFTGGSGTNSLTFTLTPTPGDVDLNGVVISSPLDLNGNPLTNLTFTPPDTSGIKINYPSFSMDFTNGVNGRYTLNENSYTDFSSFLTITGGSYTRNSIATYYNSADVLTTASANTPRFDYDPVTHAPKGLLLERSSTNIFLDSSTLDSANWNLTRAALTANDETSPENLLNAYKVTSTATGQTSNLAQRTNRTTSGNYTLSFFVKAGNVQRVLVGQHLATSSFSDNIFDLSTLTWTKVSSGSPTLSYQSVGNGWYRLSVTVNLTGTGLYSSYVGPLNNTATSQTQTTNGNYIYLWGGQFELNDNMTSYIPTTSSAYNRLSDNIDIPTSSWFSETNGSIIMQADTLYSGSSAPAQGIAIHGASNQGYLFYKQGATSNFHVFAGTAFSLLGPVTANQAFTSGISYFGTRAIGSLNGTLGGSFTPTSVTTPTHFNISDSPAGHWDGHLRLYKYYPNTITDADLSTLSAAPL